MEAHYPNRAGLDVTRHRPAAGGAKLHRFPLAQAQAQAVEKVLFTSLNYMGRVYVSILNSKIEYFAFSNSQNRIYDLSG